MADRKYRRSIERRLKEVQEALTVLESVDENWLYELQRRREQLATSDGYGSGSSADGGSRATDETSTTERAALNLLPGCHRPSYIKVKSMKKRVCTQCGFTEDQHVADPIGSSVEEIVDLLDTATKALRTIQRKYMVVVNAGDRRRGRQSLISQCGACGKDVTGYGEDRIKSGYGPCCYSSWRRYCQDCKDNGSESSHVIFRQRRAEQLAEVQDEEGAA